MTVQVTDELRDPAWSLAWPTEPGWYWTWEPGEDGMPDRLEPAQATRSRDGSMHYGMDGISIYASDYPRLHWGPRIEVPPAPAPGLPAAKPSAEAVERGDQAVRDSAGMPQRIRADIPHVWDVDGEPRGVRHEIVRDGDDLIIRDAGIDASGAIAGPPHERRIRLLTVVHALLNMTDAELTKAEHRGFGEP
jgi:hypothetical protein